jgi:hypothetical protein
MVGVFCRFGGGPAGQLYPRTKAFSFSSPPRSGRVRERFDAAVMRRSQREVVIAAAASLVRRHR